jgi:hypothetical protein
MQLNMTITKRVRHRKLSDGRGVHQTRYVLNYRNPGSGQRRQEFFERAKDAQSRKAELAAQVASGSYVDERTVPTIADVVDHWLADRTGKVKPSTLAAHKVILRTFAVR